MDLVQMMLLKMEKFTIGDEKSEELVGALTSPDTPSKFIGGQVLTEHAAYVVEHPSYSNEECVQAALTYIYRELDTKTYHYFVDASRIYVLPNEKRADSDVWVMSDTMKKISEWCSRAAETSQSLSYALVGPLGTGKTSTCEHIMDELAQRGFMMINCKLDDRTLDSTLDRIMFCVNMTQKAVILLDELDSLQISAKTSETNITPALAAMQKATGAAHAFQVVRDLPYSGADAFSYREPVAVSAQSFLSQLF